MIDLAENDGAASVAELRAVIPEPIVSERVALGLLTYRAGLGCIAICINPSMTGLCDDLAVADDLVTVKATDLSCMSLGSATIVASVHDITSDKDAIAALVDDCNRLELSTIHLLDVVEDFI